MATFIYSKDGASDAVTGVDDETGLPYTKTFDARGRITSIVLGDKVTTFDYKRNGGLRIKTSPDGQEVDVWDGLQYNPMPEWWKKRGDQWWLDLP